jgi:DNA-binding CsgD family transcriptional regulator/tetratricopeptide (TPR) repeat protein
MRSKAARLVGRDQELSRIVTALHGAREGRGSAVFLVGEAGIGKTRLATAAIGQAIQDGTVTMRGRGSTVGPMVPFRPLTEALMSLARRGLLPELSESDWTGRVLGQLAPELGISAGGPVRASVVVLSEALLHVLAAVGRQHGCLLVLEDLHDCDAETLAIVGYLLDNVHDQPIQLLATMRHEASPALDLVSATSRRDPVTVLELNRLDGEAVGELVRSLLGGPVHPRVVEMILTDSAGVPFIVEELVYDLTKSGHLLKGPGGWYLHDFPAVHVPETVARSISLRTERLGQEARSMLSIAATMGRRFALPVVRRVAGVDERSLLTTMHAGVTAQLVTPDEPAPDWYAFRHPLTAEALRSVLIPTERAVLAARVADAIEAEHPGLPGEWCAQVAALRREAGDALRAGRLFYMAGRRAMADGAARSAVTMLELAHELLADSPDSAERADAFESLLFALRETAQFDRAFELGSALTRRGDQGLTGARRAALYAQVADTAMRAGDWDAATKQLDTARALLGAEPDPADLARVDVIDARLQMGRPSSDRLAGAVQLAERAADLAGRGALPEVACDALQMLGIFSVPTDIDRANAYLERARTLAGENHLFLQRLTCEAMLAANQVRMDGSIDALQRSYEEALRLGAIPLAYDVRGMVAMQSIRRGDLDAAIAIVDEDLHVATRLQLGQARMYLLVTKAVYFAYQARRSEMEAVLDELSRDERNAWYARPATYGLARAYCSLLEENREGAVQDLDQALAIHAKTPTSMEFGKDGLPILLRVLAHRDDWPEFREVYATGSSRTRWNAQSIHLAHAVLLGRDGRVAEANDAVADALQAAAIYPLTRHLGLRLVAQEAYDHGWGDPVGWLREAEEFFHQHDIPAVAGACRAMLRQMGVSIRQRRAGTDQIPDVLRQAGVTAREYDVCQLIADRIGNKAIASRLHISPRTVEKHVASLLSKTNMPDRDSLTVYARAVLGD